MPMNQEIKAQWTAALRSGEYEQGRKHLNQGGKLCCLGVLCELAVKAGIIEKVVDNYGFAYYGGDSSILDEKVQKWAGLADLLNGHNPDVHAAGVTSISLAELNDGDEGAGREPYTFTQIADIIDAQL